MWAAFLLFEEENFSSQVRYDMFEVFEFLSQGKVLCFFLLELLF